jgi:hypothetical protein
MSNVYLQIHVRPNYSEVEIYIRRPGKNWKEKWRTERWSDQVPRQDPFNWVDIGTRVIQASQDLDVHIIPFIIYRGGINWRGPRTPTII